MYDEIHQLMLPHLFQVDVGDEETDGITLQQQRVTQNKGRQSCEKTIKPYLLY